MKARVLGPCSGCRKPVKDDQLRYTGAEHDVPPRFWHGRCFAKAHPEGGDTGLEQWERAKRNFEAALERLKAALSGPAKQARAADLRADVARPRRKQK